METRYRTNFAVVSTEFLQDKIVQYLNENFSGSGIDAGYKPGMISKNFMYIESSFHCMSEHGYYDGWQEFAIRIPLHTDWHDWILQFRYDQYKANKYILREYLEDSFHYQLTEFFNKMEEENE